MTIKEIEQAMQENKLLFGVKQAIKHKKEIDTVFISKDTRDSTVRKLEDNDIEFVVLKPKNEIAKNININFTSEVYAIKK